MPRRPTNPLRSLANLTARLARRIFDLATYSSLVVIKNTVVATVALVLLVVFASVVLRSCADRDARNLDSARRNAREPMPGLTDRERLPLYDDDEVVTVIGRDGKEWRVRWGDVKEEAERGMLPRATSMGERAR